MLKNYFVVAIRSFKKQKIYSLVNLTGLTIALTVAILAIIFIRHELSYDKWIPNNENIYQVYREFDKGFGTTWTPLPLAEMLPREFPEVQAASRMGEMGEIMISTIDKEKPLYVQDAISADSSFLKVLPFPLKYGDAATAMQSPDATLISDELAQTLFGDEDPVGKIIVYNDERDFEVTGVFAPFAGTTHFEVDIVMRDTVQRNIWSGNSRATYVALQPGVRVADLEQKMTDNITPRIKAEVGDTWEKLPTWHLQKLTDIHLDKNGVQVSGQLDGEGNMRTLYIIGIVAILILTIASINYMNLATAQATRRAREVGVRKVNGATDYQLIGQFLTEATLQALIALPLAMMLSGFILPAFETIVNRELIINFELWKSIFGYMLIIVVFLGILSGSYPAFFLAAYRPTDVLKGQWLRKDKGRVLRNGMVVAQFTGAMVAAIVMFFIYQQVKFMQHQELGFQPEQVMVIKTNTKNVYDKLESFKQQLSQNPAIRSIASTSTMPGQNHSDYSFKIEGIESDQFIDIYFTDEEYANTLDLKVKEGRYLSRADTTLKTFVVNEAFINEYNIKNPIGHPISVAFFTEEKGTIVGVVEDFHYESLENRIEPLAISGAVNFVGERIDNVAIRLSTKDIRNSVAEIEKAWKNVEPAHPIRYSFLDDDFAGLYADQERLGQTLLYATLLTLLIATLGLFALASYMAEQRIKEIGVRKVLGASVQQIVLLMGKDFMKLVLIAGIIASPIAFWLTDKWLTNFAYQMNMTVFPFMLVLGIALLISFVTVASRAIRAAMVNPIESLKSE